VRKSGVSSFRRKLTVAMMLVVVAMTGLGLYLAQRKVEIEAARDLQQDFRNELATLHSVQELRYAALTERTRALVMRPRIHAALEDNALDLLYPTARDELREILARNDETNGRDQPSNVVHAQFYRFLDSHGAVITPTRDAGVGYLQPEEEAQLTLPSVPNEQQIGYLRRRTEDGETVDEVIAMPIKSSENGSVIAALVLGLKPVELGSARTRTEIKSGIWLAGRLHLSGLSKPEESALETEVSKTLGHPAQSEDSFNVQIGGASYLLFYKQLNPGSIFPPAFEVAVYPLAESLARQQQIRWHVLLAGGGLLVGGLLASHLISRRLSRPVEKLAVTSEQYRAQRERAEAALQTTSAELQRSARFSADASHQLKTPVTVLRAGIDELLAHENFSPEVYDKLSALLHQTYRITGVIDDLLLLSRMDAGRLQIDFEPVDLSQLLEEWIDDLSALPDDLHVKVETNFVQNLRITGERRFVTLIVQNLLENARKYNRPGGSICVSARQEGDYIILCVENTGRPISAASREHIFERFHRGTVGENIPGHGLGLNLARELARLHGGDLRLVRSDDEWTEFEVRFLVAKAISPVMASSR
jgi:signal transduction histidine kinase